MVDAANLDDEALPYEHLVRFLGGPWDGEERTIRGQWKTPPLNIDLPGGFRYARSMDAIPTVYYPWDDPTINQRRQWTPKPDPGSDQP